MGEHADEMVERMSDPAGPARAQRKASRKATTPPPTERPNVTTVETDASQDANAREGQHDEPTTAPDAPEASTPGSAVANISKGALVGASINARIRYAKELAEAGLLPSHYRKNPGNVLYAVEYGTMLGIHPVAAINGIHVIEGKPTASPALMSALVRNAGHKMRVRVTGTVEAGDLKATATIVRADDPDFPFEASWTLQRAERAGLLTLKVVDGKKVPWARDSKGKPLPWEKYPEAMLKARATGEVCREAAEEVLCGARLTPEELGASVDEDGNVVEGEVVETLSPRQEVEPVRPLEARYVPEFRADLFAAFDAADPMTALRAVYDKIGPARSVTMVANHEGEVVTAMALLDAAKAAIQQGGRLHDATAPKPAEPAVAEPTGEPDAEGVVDAVLVEDETDDTPAATPADEAAAKEAAAPLAAPAEPARPSGPPTPEIARQWLNGEVQVQAEVLGTTVETMTAREARALRKPLAEWTNEEMLKVVQTYREAVAVRLKENGKGSASAAYSMLRPGSIVDVRTMLADAL